MQRPRRSRILPAIAIATAVAGIAACGSEDGGGAPKVVATTGVLADIAAGVAGPDVEVVQLIPDGSSPHDFQPSAEDRRELEEADLIVANGAGLEVGLPLDATDTLQWELTEHVSGLLKAGEGEDSHSEGASEEGTEESHDSGTVDPHVWMDPARVAGAVSSLAGALAEADPEHATAYGERGKRYAIRIRGLDTELARRLRAVQPGDRELVTSHDALAYFADRYGFGVVATPFPVSGPEAEPSAARLRDVEEAVEASDVRAVFAQAEDDPSVLEAVAAATGTEIVADLLVESPGAAGGYEEMLRRDAELIADALAPH